MLECLLISANREQHARLLKRPLATNFDLAFLWIGVNKVYSKWLKDTKRYEGCTIL